MAETAPYRFSTSSYARIYLKDETVYRVYRYDAGYRLTEDNQTVVYQYVGPEIASILDNTRHGYGREYTTRPDHPLITEAEMRKAENWKPMPALDAPLTPKNCTLYAKKAQIAAAKRHGYVGPVGSGEARALSTFLREIGKPEHVRRVYFTKETVRVRHAGKAYERRWTVSRIVGPCYVFLPLVKGHSFEDFIKVVRMYKPGEKGGCRAAIKRAMESPDFAGDLDMLNTLDSLMGLSVK